MKTPSRATAVTGQAAILWVILAYLLLGVIYSFATPVFEASDEIWHYPVVRELRNSHRLPVQRPGVKTDWEQEGSQPPLYYALAAGITFWVDDSDYEQVMIRNPFVKAGVPGTPDNVNFIAHPPGQGPWQGGTTLAVYLIRWLSLLMGAGTVYFAWRLARTVYPGHERVALLTAAIVAFNPMTLFINASVNNDNLLMLLATITLWLLADELMAMKPGVRWGRTLLLGLLMGMAALTKVSGLMLLPVAALALTLSAWRTHDWRSWFVRGIILAVAVAALAGWWYARNWRLYRDLFGTAQMALIAGPRPSDIGLTDLLREWPSFWYAYWGVFGAFNVLAPQWFFWLVSALVLAGLAGLTLRLGRALRRQQMTTWPVHLTLAAFVLLTFAGIVHWSLMTPASQGRLLFSGVAVIGMYLAAGALALAPKGWESRTARGISAILFASALLIPFISIRPAYRPPDPIASLPADASPLDVRFGDSIHLLGYQLSRPAIDAGADLEVTLYWRADALISQNYDLSLNGLGFHEENVAKLDTWPGGGLLPTSLWRAGAIYPDHYRLPTAPDADTPTTLRLSVRFSQDLSVDGVGIPLPAFANDQPVSDIILDASDLRTPAWRVQKPTQPPIALLEEGIQLHQNAVDVGEDAIHLTLIWSATQPIPADYTIFVHLVDARGELIGQGDAPPRDGYWPTSHWQPGEAVASWHAIALPQNLPPGDYILRVGMYDPASGQRLAIRSADGAEWPDRAMPIPMTAH